MFLSIGDWNCVYASDEERIFVMSEDDYNEHNRLTRSLFDANKMCYFTYDILIQKPFSDLCNIDKQYPCYRVQDIKNPDLFNVTITHPCINLSQIGDGIIDCIGGLDERNILQCPRKGMLDFNF